MHRALQTMLADTPLVKNLPNLDYMQVLLDGKQTLEELFAELDMDRQPRNLHRPPMPIECCRGSRC